MDRFRHQLRRTSIMFLLMGHTSLGWPKRNLASTRDQGNSCLKIYFIFLLILSWYSDPAPRPLRSARTLRSARED
jgi:hypothetical protein